VEGVERRDKAKRSGMRTAGNNRQKSRRDEAIRNSAKITVK
jgi:hypothetical protein